MSKKKKQTLYTNADSTVTDQERYERERDERNTEIVQRQIDKAEGYQFHGELNPKAITVTEDQINWDAEDVRRRRAEGKPVLPVYTWEDPATGEIMHLLTDADQEAVIQGYICENCLGWQKSPLSLKCETVNDFTCNYVRSW